MASDFYPVDLDDIWSFVQGPARLMIAPEATTFPTAIGDIVTPSGANAFDPVSPWTDLGATKTGVQVSVNHAEETFDVDQVFGDIESRPVNWECSVQTALAENTLEHLQVAWEGSAITSNTTPTPDERQMGYGQATRYTRRLLAVLHKNDSDLIRAIIFRRAQLQPIESQIGFNKTGEQATIPIQFKGLADASIVDVKKRFFMIYEQTATP